MNAKKSSTYKYDLSWLTLAKALWNERLLMIAVTVILSTVLVVIVRRLPAVYRAEALVLVDSQKIPERFVSSTVTAEVQDRLTTISQEILSSTRLYKVINDFNLYVEQRKTMVREEILEIMRRDLEVKVERAGGGSRPGAFRIIYQGADPMTVAQVTNRIANLYIEENLRTREVQAEGTSEFIDHQLQQARKQLDQLETSVSQYKIQHNGELPQQENSLSSTLGRLHTELTGAQDNINRAEQTKLLLQNSLAAAENAEALLARALRQTPAAAATNGDEDEVPPVAVPRAPLPSEQAAGRLQALRLRYSDEHPEVKEAIRELERLKSSERAEQAAERPASPAQVVRRSRPEPQLGPDHAALLAQLSQARERTTSLRAQIAAVEKDIQTRQADQRRVLRDIGGYEARIQKLPLREQEMAGLTRDYEIAKNNYRSLLDKKIAAEMASDLERRQKAERFTILDPARVPEKPAKPNRPLFYAASVLGSLALGIVIAMGKGLSQDRLLGEWELPKDVPVLGRVPRITLEPTAAPPRRWKLTALLSALLSGIGSVAGAIRLSWF